MKGNETKDQKFGLKGKTNGSTKNILKKETEWELKDLCENKSKKK